jgi:hypothetical protein
MTWSTIIITPLTFLFKDVKKLTLNYEWFVDSIWLVEIFLSFFKGHLVHAKDLNMAAKRYMFDGRFNIGAFWFDAASTIPPMIFKEQRLSINALKFLRLYHINEMFYPIEMATRKIFRNFANYYIDSLVAAINFFATILLLAHLIACTWIFIGRYDSIFEKEVKRSWLSIEDETNIFYNTTWHYKYFYAYYWVF